MLLKRFNIKWPSVTTLNNTKVSKAIFLFYGVLVLVGIYHAAFAKRIIPGVVIGNVHVGGMKYYQALDLLKKSEEQLDKTITFEFESKTYDITPQDVNFSYDWESAVTRAFEVGRTKDFFIDTKDKFAGIFKSLYLPTRYDIDTDLLDKEFSYIKAEVNQEGQNSKVAFDEKENIIITPSTIGRRVSKEDLYNIAIESYNRLDFAKKTLPVHIDNPTIVEQQISPLLDDVKSIVNKTITLTYDDKKILVEKKQLLDFIEFTLEKDNKVLLTINKPKLDAFVKLIGQDVNKLPKGHVTKTEDDKVTEFEIIDQGTEIDETKFKEEFKDLYFKTFKDATLAISTKPTDAPTKEKYGILAKLGEGVSKYTGSGTERVHNLVLAAERTDGILVPPGGTYSFNKSVGEISRATGYATAYVISNGRTVLGDGGGVCQTSTTLFRAVLNSGLPVVARYPHAYRVRYYEIESPLGLDASVYQPSLDFQFKNDTQNYILIQADAQPKDYSLKFTIYGTPDDRKVELTEPIVTNQTAPPEALYQDDPTLPKGVTKQVDFSAWGATVSFTRTVTRDGETINTDTYTTRYQPWRAVFLVGTKK